MKREARLREQSLAWWAERAHSMTVSCPDPGCEQPVDSPCVGRDGEVLQGPPGHGNRIRNADRLAGRRPERGAAAEQQPERTVTVDTTDDGIRSQPCNWCKQPIVWASTRLDKLMPVDAEPVPTGNIMLTLDHGRVRAGVLGHNQAAGARDTGKDLYQHHKLSCTHVQRWGRR